MSLNVGLIGYGNMGKKIEQLASGFSNLRITCIIDTPKENEKFDSEAFKQLDVAIDFSHPNAVVNHIHHCLEYHIPLVVGTTGWLSHEGEIRSKVQDKKGVVLVGSNFSLGVHLFRLLIEKAGVLLGGLDEFHPSFHEVHHILKADAPSGTALTLAETFNQASPKRRTIQTSVPNAEKVDPDALYVTSQRSGGVFGDHELRMVSDYDDITLKHQARNRDGFASGTLKSALWVAQAPSGFYKIEDVLKDVLTFSS